MFQVLSLPTDTPISSAPPPAVYTNPEEIHIDGDGEEDAVSSQQLTSACIGPELGGVSCPPPELGGVSCPPPELGGVSCPPPELGGVSCPPPELGGVSCPPPELGGASSPCSHPPDTSGDDVVKGDGSAGSCGNVCDSVAKEEEEEGTLIASGVSEPPVPQDTT